MAIKRLQGSMNVVEAAKLRIKNVFSNGLPVYLSFSGGKDSICLAHVVYGLIQSGVIDPKQLTLVFVDEEAIFPCIEESVKKWRKKFMLAGSKFDWWCVEVRHFNCFNELTEDESFICWDRNYKDVWVRTPPSFAKRSHPLLNPGVDSYQVFMPRVYQDGIMLTGVRAGESVQRAQYMSNLRMGTKGITGKNMIYPIYDWRDRDVWLYLYRENIDIPKVYLYLWQSGVSKRRLRVSQFFSSDTAGSLVKMNEYYPNLMDRIIKREPNAYLATLYWDSEMFGRSTAQRKRAEGKSKKDYKALVSEMLFENPAKYFTTKNKLLVAKQYRRMFIRLDGLATQKHYKNMYESLIAGDPKRRSMRALYSRIGADYAEYSKQSRKGGENNS